MSKVNYPEIISKTIETMMMSQQRTFLAVQLGQVIRQNHKGLSTSQVQTAIRKLKDDKRIKVTKVSNTKQYISYQGVC